MNSAISFCWPARLMTYACAPQCFIDQGTKGPFEFSTDAMVLLLLDSSCRISHSGGACWTKSRMMQAVRLQLALKSKAS